jgi:hypothetical protein
MLHRLGPSVCVTADEWAGFEHAAALAEIASRSPELRHRVVLGRPADGEIDFRSFFEETPWERVSHLERDTTRLSDARRQSRDHLRGKTDLNRDIGSSIVNAAQEQ